MFSSDICNITYIEISILYQALKWNMDWIARKK